MIPPQFPYSGSQAMIASNRVTLYSKQDGIFLFGKSTVGISSQGTINLDTNKEVKVFANKISLGENAAQPVILGSILVDDLKRLFSSLDLFAASLSTMNETELSKIVDQIRTSSTKLQDSIKRIDLDKSLSKTTFTK